MFVDSHVHVWASDPLRYPWRPALAHVPIPTMRAPAEALLAEMDAAAVTHTVLVQPSVYGPDNSYLIECLQRWPSRFAGVCSIGLDSADPRADLARWCGPARCVGLRLNIIRHPDPGFLLSPERQSLWQAVEEFALAVSLHMDLDRAPLAAALAEHHPGTTFMIDYLGAEVYRGGDHGRLLDLLANRQNIWFKLICAAEDLRMPYPFADVAGFYESVFDRFGSARMLFGSDYPGVQNVCSYVDAVAWPAHLKFLSEADRERITAGNPASVFRLLR